MKKRIVQIAVSLALSLILIPICVSASGGYCVIKGEEVYHSVFCSETWGYNIEDMKWCKTAKEIERTGYKPCEYCADAMFDYEEDGSTRWFSKDEKIQNALEMERFMGCMDSLKVLEEERDVAYEEGKSAGYEDARHEFETKLEQELNEAKKLARKDGRNVTLLLCVIFGIPVVCYFNTEKCEKEFNEKEVKYRTEIQTLRAELSSLKSPPTNTEKINSATDFERKRSIMAKISRLQRIIDDADTSYRENKKILSESFSDYELDIMVHNGEFPADRVEDYKDQRKSLEMIISFMPKARDDMVKNIERLKQELKTIESSIGSESNRTPYNGAILAEPYMPLNVLKSFTRDKDGDLILEMMDGSEYCYYDFPKSLYREMKNFYNTAEFIDRHVKGKYKCEKIT